MEKCPRPLLHHASKCTAGVLACPEREAPLIVPRLHYPHPSIFPPIFCSLRLCVNSFSSDNNAPTRAPNSRDTLSTHLHRRAFFHPLQPRHTRARSPICSPITSHRSWHWCPANEPHPARSAKHCPICLCIPFFRRAAHDPTPYATHRKSPKGPQPPKSVPASHRHGPSRSLRSQRVSCCGRGVKTLLLTPEL